MNNEFDWTGLPEISGFGGGYEDACRKMVRAGVEWLRAHPDAKLKAVRNAIAEAVGDCTGAMVCAATHHALCIHRIGWDKYVEEFKKARAGRKEDEE